MQELRFVAVSEDGSYAVLAVPGRSGRYILPIDERLRAVALGQTSRLAQYEIEVESPLRPKEIQARIRAGETAEEIADAAGIPVERVRWFEGPVLAERAYIADQAQAGSVRRAGDSAGPGPRLGDIVTARLSAAGADPADGQWDSRKRGDGNWQVSLMFPSGGRLHVAEWVFDPRRRHVMPDDDNAARLSLPESELPAEPVPVPGEATVTPIAPRLGAAAGMGGGSVGGPGVSRFRPDRSVIPDRSLGLDRSLVERPPSVPSPERTAVSDRSAVSDRFAVTERPPAPTPSRPAPQDRAGYQDRSGYESRPANPGYAEFPESAPYHAPEPAPEPPPAPRDQAPEQADHSDQDAGHHAAAADVPPAAQVPAAQVSSAPATEDSERVRLTPPRPVIFEDPGPTFLEQSEPARDHAPAGPAPSAAEPRPVSRPEPPVPAAAPSVTAPNIAVPPAEQPEAGRPESAAEPEVTAASATEPAAPTAAEPAAQTAKPAAQTAEPSAPATPASAARPRPGAKKNAKARRSSVPSWDEIMLGSSRQRD